MTHKDIYTKFMIEYDKANATSSYPSLTEFEVATVLDKSYNALIAQKVSGNNIRRAGFEMDLKAMEDLAPLVVQDSVTLTQNSAVAENVYSGQLKDNHLYFIDGYLKKDSTIGSIVDYTRAEFISFDHMDASLFDLDNIEGTLYINITALFNANHGFANNGLFLSLPTQLRYN